MDAELLDPVREGRKAASARPKGEGVVVEYGGVDVGQMDSEVET